MNFHLGGPSNVKTAVNGWADLSKSKSSAAILQEENRKRVRAQSKDRVFANTEMNEVDFKSVNLSEAHTNQVQETVTKWGTKSEQKLQGNFNGQFL